MFTVTHEVYYLCCRIESSGGENRILEVPYTRYSHLVLRTYFTITLSIKSHCHTIFGIGLNLHKGTMTVPTLTPMAIDRREPSVCDRLLMLFRASHYISHQHKHFLGQGRQATAHSLSIGTQGHRSSKLPGISSSTRHSQIFRLI